MKVAIIYGSVREDRQGIKAARFIEKKLKARKHEVIFIDPKNYELPLLDKMFKEFDTAPKVMQELHELLKSADAYIICSAEYNHGMPAALKNLLDHFQSEYFFKTAGIMTYSAGPFAGMRVAMHLRAVLPELGMITIPTIYGVSEVQDSFDEKGSDLNGRYEKNVKKFLDEFEWYARALKENKAKKPY